jgi:DNA-binding transcriptional regulator YiaG
MVEMTGQQLRDDRRKAGLSMAEAARMTGTPYATWQGWEADGTKNARRPPPIVFAWLELYERLKGHESP